MFVDPGVEGVFLTLLPARRRFFGSFAELARCARPDGGFFLQHEKGRKMVTTGARRSTHLVVKEFAAE
jgi:hypothetical protein